MDEKTQRELNKISRGVPAHLAKNITKTVVDKSEEDLAKRMIKSGKMSSGKKAQMQRMVNDGAFRREETVVNEKVVKELDEYHRTKVEQARRDGKLTDPKKDKFIRQRAYKIRHRK